MKFLVLALCVCAASAASFGFKPQQYQAQQYQPQQVAKAFVKTEGAPVSAGPAFDNAAYAAAQVAIVPVAAAKAVYNQAKEVYNKGQEYSAKILRSESEVNPDGFKYGYETENGISAQAQGFAKNVEDTVVYGIDGSYRYTAPDGTPVEVSYIADENGFQPQSNLLPVGPPTPEYIIRSIEYIRTHAKPETN